MAIAIGYIFLVKGKGGGMTLAEQQRIIREYGEAQRFSVRDLFVEEQEGTPQTFLERREGERLVSMLGGGDAIITAKAEWVLGSAREGLHLVQLLLEKGVSLHCIDLGGDIVCQGERKLVVSQGIAPLVQRLLTALAACEANRHGQAIRQTKLQQRKEGRYLGGPVPFGWRVGRDGVLEAHPEQQKIIQDVKRLREDRWSYRDISRKLKEEHGVSLSHEGVRKMLAFNSKRLEGMGGQG